MTYESEAAGAEVTRSERLVLRRLALEDAPFILKLLNEPSFLEHIGDKGVRTLDDAREYLATGPLASYERFGFGLYAVCLAETGEAIGMSGLLERDVLDDPDIGFAFLPEHWRCGYAFEAAEAVLAHAAADFGLRRVVAVTSPGNVSSASLLEKLGMRFEAMVEMSPGDECRLFGIELPRSAAG